MTVLCRMDRARLSLYSILDYIILLIWCFEEIFNQVRSNRVQQCRPTFFRCLGSGSIFHIGGLEKELQAKNQTNQRQGES